MILEQWIQFEQLGFKENRLKSKEKMYHIWMRVKRYHSSWREKESTGRNGNSSTRLSYEAKDANQTFAP